MGYKVNHARMKERYHRFPNAAERRFHIQLMDWPCLSCGVQPCGVFHHLLTDTPEKRFRRDHEMGLNLCDSCHRSLHSDGDEWAWCMARGIEPVAAAISNRDWGRKQGLLPERARNE
jgi:hypothetical protein